MKVGDIFRFSGKAVLEPKKEGSSPTASPKKVSDQKEAKNSQFTPSGVASLKSSLSPSIKAGAAICEIKSKPLTKLQRANQLYNEALSTTKISLNSDSFDIEQLFDAVNMLEEASENCKTQDLLTKIRHLQVLIFFLFEPRRLDLREVARSYCLELMQKNTDKQPYLQALKWGADFYTIFSSGKKQSVIDKAFIAYDGLIKQLKNILYDNAPPVGCCPILEKSNNPVLNELQKETDYTLKEARKASILQL